MINILIPMAGKKQFLDESKYIYPKPLIEICGKTMIELVIENFKSIKEKKFIFILQHDDCKKYHLDKVVNLLTNNQCKIITVNGETQGIACSALLAIQTINNNTPLIISNPDQIFEENIREVIFQFKDVDGGVISFNSIHPKWSHVKLDDEGYIIETSVKRPISHHAIAEFFYFKEGKNFINSAMRMIEKDVNVNGVYYISPILNEMVLENRKLQIIMIDNMKYHSFDSSKKIEDYENRKKLRNN